jgi:hypothetical protein
MLILMTSVWVICLYLFDATAEKWSPDKQKNVRTTYDGKANPLAKEYNDRTLDERIGRVNTYVPTGKAEEKVYAPVLEAFRQREFDGMPEYVRSSLIDKKDTANAPHYHPEDLLPRNIPLLSNGGKDADKPGAVRLPIQTVIDQTKTLGLNESLFKHQTKQKSEYDPTAMNPSSVVTPNAKASNGGQAPAEKPQDDHGKEKH